MSYYPFLGGAADRPLLPKKEPMLENLSQDEFTECDNEGGAHAKILEGGNKVECTGNPESGGSLGEVFSKRTTTRTITSQQFGKTKAVTLTPFHYKTVSQPYPSEFFNTFLLKCENGTVFSWTDNLTNEIKKVASGISKISISHDSMVAPDTVALYGSNQLKILDKKSLEGFEYKIPSIHPIEINTGPLAEIEGSLKTESYYEYSFNLNEAMHEKMLCYWKDQTRSKYAFLLTPQKGEGELLLKGDELMGTPKLMRLSPHPLEIPITFQGKLSQSQIKIKDKGVSITPTLNGTGETVGPDYFTLPVVYSQAEIIKIESGFSEDQTLCSILLTLSNQQQLLYTFKENSDYYNPANKGKVMNLLSVDYF